MTMVIGSCEEDSLQGENRKSGGGGHNPGRTYGSSDTTGWPWGWKEMAGF